MTETNATGFEEGTPPDAGEDRVHPDSGTAVVPGQTQPEETANETGPSVSPTGGAPTGSGDPPEGIVYVLTNERMPDLVKIGVVERGNKEAHLSARVKDLSRATGVPLPFEVHYAARVRSPKRLEQKLFRLFSDARVSPKREFFEVDPEKVVVAIGIGDHEDLVPQSADGAEDDEEQAALDRAKSRRPKINLRKIGVNPGDLLVFSRDDSVTATVVDETQVEFEGEIMALSPAANVVLQRRGLRGGVAGTEYWTFDGETLNARRNRLEREAFEEPGA